MVEIPWELYFQVAKQLEQAIESGNLPPGTRLENEILLGFYQLRAVTADHAPCHAVPGRQGAARAQARHRQPCVAVLLRAQPPRQPLLTHHQDSPGRLCRTERG